MITVTVARKPIDGDTIGVILEWGVGGLDIEQTRIPTSDSLFGGAYSKSFMDRDTYFGSSRPKFFQGLRIRGQECFHQPSGRWPANVIVETTPEVLKTFDEFGDKKPGGSIKTQSSGAIWGSAKSLEFDAYNDSGTAIRFFKQVPPCSP